jgi:hypothetical protein
MVAKDQEEVYWLDNDDHYPRDVWCKSHELAIYYSKFMRKPDMDPRKFGLRLSELARGEQVQKRNLYKTGAAEYLVPSSLHPKSADAAKSEPSNSTVIAMIPRQTRQK